MERDLSQETAERLLSGDLTPPPQGAERLAALLAVASAPARPDELAGEAAAMAAFRAHPPTVRRWSLRRALTIKVAAIVAATVAAGGVALASGTGLLPNPFNPADVEQSPSSPAGSPHRSPNPDKSKDEHTQPDQSLSGLCHAYQGKAPSERGKALQAPPFAALVREAGGADRVDAFCAGILATPNPDKSKEADLRKVSPTPRPMSSRANAH